MLAPERLKRVVPFVVALVMGVVAVILNSRYLAKQREALELERQKVMANYQAPVDVVVAAKDLPEDTALEPSQLRLAVIPEKFVQPYAAHAVSEVAGQVTLVPMAEGEQILLNKLRRPEEGPRGTGLSSVTPKGKRAVTIAVDTLTGVGGFVRPGDIVDVLWTLQLPAADTNQGQMVTLTLFQDVPVLAVGTTTLAGQGSTETASKEESQQTQPQQYTVTLALTPQETSFLLFAREQGRIQLSLRPQTETGSKVSVAPANINTLLEQQLGIPAPTESKTTHQVEVYKGLERGVVDVTEKK